MRPQLWSFQKQSRVRNPSITIAFTPEAHLPVWKLLVVSAKDSVHGMWQSMSPQRPLESHPGPRLLSREGKRSTLTWSHRIWDANGCWLVSNALAMCFNACLAIWTQQRKNHSWKGNVAFRLEFSGPHVGGRPFPSRWAVLFSVCVTVEGPTEGLGDRCLQHCTRCSHSGGSGRCTIFFLTSCGFAGSESEKPIFIFKPVWAHLVNQSGLLFTLALGHQERWVMSR